VDPLEYALLAWVESGHVVFQPTEPTEAERQSFQRTAARVLDLRERGWIEVAAAHISRSGSGHYLRIGPCALSAEGRAALVNAGWLLGRSAKPGGPSRRDRAEKCRSSM
jgi:hypothetical protein